MTKKLLLTFALLLTAVTGAFADDSGSCGEYVSYSYVESTQTLTITGTWAMADYASSSDQPWKDYRSSIKTVVIGAGVTSIGDNAFNGCSNLTSITIPANVTSIGERAFVVCSNLATVSFAVGSQLTSIGERAFGGCEGLTSIEIPASVTSIGERAFNNCSNLATISFAAGSQLETIEGYAFNSCSDLTSITIPASVTSISGDAFAYCSKLETMTVEDGNEVYDSRNNCNALIEKSTNTLIVGCNNSTIPDGVTSIGRGAFASTGLTSIEIPASVTSIDRGAFAVCSMLASVSFAEGSQLTSIGDIAFESCEGLTSIEIPASVTTIGGYAFESCSGLTTVSFAAGSQLTTIGKRVFNSCSDLTSITIPASVTSISADAFGWCSKLETMTVEDGNKVYDSRNGCNAIIEKSSNTLIIGCNGSTIPDGVTTIGDRAFNECSGLTSITIPASVTTIGEWAFNGCFKLATVTVYAPSCTLGDLAFESCPELTIYVLSDLVDYYKDADNWKNYADKIEGISTPNGNCGENVRWVLTGKYPNYTLTITGTGAMADYDNDDELLLYDYAENIKTIFIGAGVTNIVDNAFEFCGNLRSVSFAAGSQLKTIGNYAFANTGLTSIEIPASVTSIGERAFEDCTGLATVTVFAPSCSLGVDAFNSCDNLTNIYVLSNYVGTYKSAWSAYADKISVMFDGISTTTVNIPNDVTVNGVLYNRTFTTSKPSTVMLPFSKAVDDISGGTFYTFGGVQKENDKWVAKMKEVTGSIEANTPYLFMPTGTSLTFTGGATLNTTGGGNGVTADQGSHWTFKGTYEYKEWISGGANAEEIGKAYGFAGVAKDDINVGDFVKVASGAKIRPMGCYLLWNDTPNASRAAARGAATEELPQSITVRLVSADGEVTNIDVRCKMEEGRGDVYYDLSGRLLQGKPTKKGLYINNGKKIVIK